MMRPLGRVNWKGTALNAEIAIFCCSLPRCPERAMPPPFKKSFHRPSGGPAGGPPDVRQDGRDGPRDSGYKGNRDGDRKGGDRKGGDHKRGRDGARFAGRPPQRRDEDDTVRLYGIHAVEAALANPNRIITRVMVTENAENRLAAALAKRGLTPERTTPRDLDRLLGNDTVHQGIMIECEALEEPDIDTIAEIAAGGGGPVLVLDQVTDPHNVGAVLRSAAVFGAAGVVMHRRHSPPLNGTLAKSASGALELVPVVLATNLARTLEELRDSGFTILALDGEAESLLEDEPLTGAVALVLGAEGKGLRQLTVKTSDRMVKIATGGSLDSLNVSNAAAIALHLAAMRRRGK
jgi:23S rRNA (guanosine2251-2'-O)-methyltransferase